MPATPFPTATTEAEARASWEAGRLTFVGGSEAFELLNRPQYGRGCARALAYRKLGAEPDYPDPPQEDDALFRRGTILEPIVATLYSEKTGRQLRRPPQDFFNFPIPRRHAQFPWAAVNTDRTILAGANAPSTGDLEIKTRDQGPWMRVHRSGPFDGDELQLQWSLWVTGHRWGALATLGVFGGLPLTYFDREADAAVQEMFTRAGSEFADTVWGHNELPEPEFPATDQRCKVCEYRMSCRGEEIDKAEASALRQMKRSSKNLVQIDDPELAVQLSEMDLLKQEEKAIKAALDVVKENVEFRLEEVQEGAVIRGYGRVLRVQVEPHMVSYMADGYSYLRRYPEKP